MANLSIKYEGVVHTSCHSEFPPGMIIQSNFVEQYEFGSGMWMRVVLSNGIDRDILAKDVKQL